MPESCFRGRVWPGAGQAVLEDGLVFVRNGLVRDVVRAEPEFRVPEHIQCYDFTSESGVVTLMPGILDGHVHKAWDPDARRSLLLRGVTAMGDLAAPLNRLSLLAQDRDSRNRPAARASWSGPMLTAPGGYPVDAYGAQWALEVDSPRAAARAVERLAGLGARMVKLGFEPGPHGQTPMLGLESAREAAAQARQLGLVTRCHCQDAAGLERALDVGVDVVEHVPDRWTLENGEIRPVYAGSLDALEPSGPFVELIRRMAGQGVAWTPTLTAGAERSWLVRGMQAAVALFAGLGGRVVLGTDAGFLGIEPDMPHREMRLLAGCGLNPEKVLAAATENAALACGFPNLGRLAVGREADLVAVRGDPLGDLSVFMEPDRMLLAVSRGRIA